MRDRAETTLFRTAMRTVAGLVAAFALLLQLSLASPLAIRALGIVPAARPHKSLKIHATVNPS
jgi:hypothetical protein